MDVPLIAADPLAPRELRGRQSQNHSLVIRLNALTDLVRRLLRHCYAAKVAWSRRMELDDEVQNTQLKGSKVKRQTFRQRTAQSAV